MLLDGQTAVVTGCSRGIGRAILEKFAEHGARVFACARKETPNLRNEIAELTDKYSVDIFPIYFDLLDPTAVRAGAKTVLEKSKNIDVLVNNAGSIATAPFHMTTEKKIRELFEINYLSQIIFSQYIARAMIRNRSGSIVNIVSTAAIDGNEGRLGYVASKAALMASSKVMASELAPFGIRVNALAPGLTDTRMMRDNTDPAVIEETISATLLKRVGKSSEVSDVALFLASNMSAYITGQTIRVDGGM